MPTLLKLQESRFRLAPSTAPVARRLTVTPDRIQSHGLDLAGVLEAVGDRAWSGRRSRKATPIANARASKRATTSRSSARASVQVTNLGITVKDSPQNTLVFVTRLDTGAPVAGAKVSIVTLDSKAVVDRHDRRGRRGDGAADAAARPARLVRSSRSSSPPRKTATSPTSAATGTKASSRGTSASTSISSEADPLLRGTVFTDRGVYKLGEEVHFKAVLRSNTPDGIRLLRRRHAGLHRGPRQPQQGRRRAHRQGQRVEHRRVDAAVAARGQRSATTSSARMLESDRPKPRRRRRRARRSARRRDYRDIQEDGERLVPGRRVSPS